MFQAICNRWHHPQVDLFTTRFNNKLPQFVSLVPDPQAWAVDALSLSWEDLDPYAFPLAAILGKVVEKLQDYPCNRIILIAPGWPNMAWFWDLVAMSSQIPLCLASIPNLVFQSFNQVLHRNLSNLNLHAWLLEPQQSRSKASLRQWQHELRLLKEDQPDLSMRQNGPFLQSGASVIRWTSGHHLWKPLLTSSCTCFKTRSYNQALLMATDQPLLTNWAIQPLMSAKMRISLVSWIVSIETDPRAGGASPPGTFPWYCTSSQRLPLNPLKRPPWNISLSRLFSYWPWVQVNAGVRPMLGYIRTSDTSHWSKVSLYPSPSFLSKNQLAKEGPDSVAPVVIPALAPSLDRSFKGDRSLCPVRALRYYLDRTSDLRQNKELVFVSFKKGFDKDISPATISSWIKQTVILCYELSDQEALSLHQVKAHDVRAFAASKAFQSGVSLDQILSACHWKSHNTFTQFYLKDVAWADLELFHLGPVVAAQQVHHQTQKWWDIIYM